MRILVIGAKGTLGKALCRQAEAAGHSVVPLDLPECDITDPPGIASTVQTIAPDVVINSAAYTNVDGAESDPATAYRVNALGTRNLALACEQEGIPLVHISTNMVFDGTKGSPYTEFDVPCPRGVYATTKYAGDLYVQHLMTRFYIARTAWLYGREGDSFVHKIVRAADARGSLSVVEDEISSPTYAEDLAEALVKLAGTGLYGWYNLVNEGECSRMEFAREIMRLTGREQVPITPTHLADYVRPAYTPPYSPLKNFVGAQAGIVLPPWQEALANYLSSVEKAGTPG